MRARITTAIILLVAFFALIPVGASAAVSSVSGDIVEIDAPPGVSQGDLESDSDIVVFSESTNVTLEYNVITAISEPGTYSKLSHLTLGYIPEGTEVNSYLLHSDPEGRRYFPKTYEGTVVFDEDILGIVVTGLGLIPTDYILGNPDTDYSHDLLFRGVELYFNNDRVTLDEDMRTVTIKFKTSRRLDEIRVITAAQAEPANTPPELDAIDDETITEGTSLDVDVNSTDADGDDLTISFDTDGSPGLPAFGSFTPTGNGTGTMELNPQPGDAGVYLITVTASDGEDSDSESFTLTVDELIAGGTELPTEGLIGYWAFDEGTGSTAADSTINSNDGVLTGNPTWISSGLAGGAISFDGANDYVTMGDQPLFELPEYTWSLWVNSPASQASGPTTQPLSNADQQFSFSWNHDKVRFVGAAAHGIGSEQFLGAQIFSQVSTNTWHNVVGTYDGSFLRIYLDGALHEETAGAAPVTTAGDLLVGAGLDVELNAANFFTGSIDELRIYDRSLSNVEVDLLSRQAASETVNLNSSLAAHWAFDEGTGQTAGDSSANGLDGTLGADTNVGTDDPTWVSGAVGANALSFDGVDDYVTAGDQPEFELLDEYSWSLWVNASAPPGGTTTTQPLSNADQQFVMSWDHANSAFVASAAHGTGGGNFISAQIGSELMADTWYQVTATFDGENLRIYLDGVLEAALFVGGGPVQTDGPLHIGAGVNSLGNPTVFFDGSIDDVRVYGRVLNGLEVEALAAQ